MTGGGDVVALADEVLSRSAWSCADGYSSLFDYHEEWKLPDDRKRSRDSL